MEKEALNRFGELLMGMVRDRAIVDWDMIIDGRMKGRTAQEAARRLSVVRPEEIEVLRWLVPQIVDTTLHYLLWMLEQERSVAVVVKTEAGTVENVEEVSDGLCGELYSNDGWIRRFSRQRYDGE